MIIIILTILILTIIISLKTIETFSIRFFMGNGKPRTAKCHVTTAFGHVCSLQFTFEPLEGLSAVSDLRQAFLSQKIVQPDI